MNVKIEKLVYGGEGLGHAEGATIFVPFVIPGEVAAIRAIEKRKKFVRGTLLQVAQPSPERTAPPCAHFTACGGCHYQHIPYDAQLRYKTEILRETLARIGKVEWTGEIHAHASPPLGYRNRAQWKARPAADAASPNFLGYNRAGSSVVLPVEACPILAPGLEQVFQALRRLVTGNSLPSTLREAEAFCDADGTRVLLNLSFSRFEGSARDISETLRSAVPAAASILLYDSATDRFELDGPGFIHYAAAGHAYRVGHLSFFQVNRYLVDKMVELVTANEAGDTALDLFAGAGLFSVPLAKRFAKVIAVEANEAAVRDLQSNADAAGGRVHALTQETDRFLANVKEKPELVLLDPPRAGLGAESVARLHRLAPSRIVYLSCDPSTLARDVGAFLSPGAPARYQIREVHLLDVFPQTFHIETLVRLELA